MAKKRLIGRDGDVYSVKKGSPVNGDGTTELKDGYYVATSIGEDSALPKGLETGYPFKATSGMIPKSGDVVIPLELTKRCDIRNFSIEYNADEIDVTTLCDDEKTYRAGFVDASGSMEGVTTIDVSEDLLNKFVPIVTEDTSVSEVEISEINNDPLLVKLDLNAEKAGGDVMSYFASVVVTSYNIGATVDDAQTFTANFRITPDNEIRPCILKEIV